MLARPLRFVRRVVRRAFESCGYDVRPRSDLPYGLDFKYDLMRLMGAWSAPVRVVFDVGANEGQTSEGCLNFFKEAKVFAFEPYPTSFSQLCHRFAGSHRFSAHNVALGDAIGVAPLYEYQTSLVNSLVPDAQFAIRFGKTAKTINAQCTTLDEFTRTNNIKQIDLLKIDTEGYDFHVLRGARDTLGAGHIRAVYFEFNSMYPKAGTTGGALVPLAELLTSFGFEFVATYTDYVVTEGEMFMVANALFVLPPGRQTRGSTCTE